MILREWGTQAAQRCDALGHSPSRETIRRPVHSGRGLQVFDKVEEQLRQHLTGRGVADINSLRGLTHRRVAEAEMRHDARAAIDPEKCTNCGLCARVCFKQAPVEADGATRIHTEHCVGCGLCVSVCPQNAICHYIRFLPKTWFLPPISAVSLNIYSGG